MADNSTVSDPDEAAALAAGFKPAPSTPTVVDPDEAAALAAGFKPAPTSDPDETAALAAGFKPLTLTNDQIQQKMPRWKGILTGQSFGSDADWAEMTAAGIPQDTIQRAQTETALRQEYIDQQAQSPGKRLWNGATGAIGSIWQGIAGLPKLAAAIGSQNPVDRMTGTASAVEGASQAATGVLGMAKDLVTGVKNTVLPSPRDPEQDYQNWKAQQLLTRNIPGYAPAPTSSRVQDALQYVSGIPAKAFPAPDPDQTAAASLAASIPLFEGATGLVGKVVPAALKATGAAEFASKYAPTLANLGDQAGAQAAKLRNAMNEAATPGSTPLLAKDVTAPIAKAATGVRDLAISGAGKLVSASGNAATALADKINSIPGINSSAAQLLASTVVGPKAVMVADAALGVLAKAGPKAADVGDAMSRIATANPNDPFGRLMAVATDADAPPWLKTWVKNPAIQLAARAGTLGAGALKGAAEGAATGAALSTISDNSPEETGANIANFAGFGALHGGLSAPQAKVFDANIGAVSKYITDSLASGVTPETLKLVPENVILKAAQLHSALPGVNIKFVTSEADAPGSYPFGQGGDAAGQAGYYDRANKTLWIDPTKRESEATLLHEAMHPIFDNLVAQQPGVVADLDRALAKDGKSISDFKQDYANAVFPNDPQKASEFIASQDAASPTWAHSEMLSESAAHNLQGKDLLQAMQGRVQDAALTPALSGANKWLSDLGVSFANREGGTIFPKFENTIATPELRRLTYKLIKAQRDSLTNPTTEAPPTPVTKADMGGKKAPYYPMPGGVQGNAYGREVTLPSGKTDFKPWPKSELRKRAQAEADARKKYFPEVGKPVTAMPAGLEADPAIQPWTKAALKAVFDSIADKSNLSGFYHRLNSENSATSDKGWAADVARTLGNTQVSWQSGKPLGVEMTKKGNLIVRWESEEAENQKLREWAKRHGPLSLDLWGGDIAKAKQDIATYLQNHASGQPGDANGIGADKKNVINALLAGSNKEFEATNPLRGQLKKADRAGTMRSLRVDRMESASPDTSERPPANWESLKRNLSPAAETEAPPAGAKFSPAAVEKRDIELTGPDGKKYPASFDGIQETGVPGQGWLQITPKEDLPGATVKNSTTYHPSLEKKGYTLPPEIYQELEKFKAQSAAAPRFSPSTAPRAVKSAAVRDTNTGKIYEGAIHSLAREKVPPDNRTSLEDGFVTNNGQFLNREDAYKRVLQQKQLTKEQGAESGMAYEPDGSKGLLESFDFDPVGARKAMQDRIVNGHPGYQYSPAADESGEHPISKVIDDTFEGKMIPAAQLAATLRSEKNGVADAYKASGLPSFLKGKTRVAKANVKEFLSIPLKSDVPDTTKYPDDIDESARGLLGIAARKAASLVESHGGTPLETKVVGSVLSRRDPKDIDIAVRVEDVAPFIGKPAPAAVDHMVGGFPVDTFLTDGSRWLAATSTETGAKFLSITPDKKLKGAFKSNIKPGKTPQSSKPTVSVSAAL